MNSFHTLLIEKMILLIPRLHAVEAANIYSATVSKTTSSSFENLDYRIEQGNGSRSVLSSTEC